MQAKENCQGECQWHEQSSAGKSKLCGLTREQTMNLAMAVGKLLLKNGAETSRVEDSVTRLSYHFGVTDLNVFVTPTFIILGDEYTEGKSIVCRIRSRSVNLNILSLVNDFTYGLNEWNYDYEETMAYLNEMLSMQPPYNKWLLCLASALGSACFAQLLGGNVYDFIAAFVTGGVAAVLLKLLAGYRPSAFWENVLAGAAIGATAILCCTLSNKCTMEAITVGALMPFLPGLAFTNGLRDYMAGDLISGNSRVSEAVIFAMSIAIGLAISLGLWWNFGWDLWRWR